MADLNDYEAILQAIQGAQQKADKRNYFAPMAQSFNSFQLGEGASTGEQGLAGLLRGLGSGYFGQRAINQHNEQQKTLQDAAFRMFGGETVARPDSIDTSVWAPLESGVSAALFRRKLQDSDEYQKLQRELTKQGLLKQLEAESQMDLEYAKARAGAFGPKQEARIDRAFGRNQQKEIEAARTPVEVPDVRPEVPSATAPTTPRKTYADFLDDTGDPATARQEYEDYKETESFKGTPLENVPAKFRPEAAKELETQDKVKASYAYIDDAFERAKDLVGLSAAIGRNAPLINTKKGNALSGLSDSLILQIDAVLGRELNSDVRERILSLAPISTDKPADLDRKRAELKKVVSSLKPSTPIISRFSKESKNRGGTSTWGEPTTATAGNTPTREQILQELARRKGK